MAFQCLKGILRKMKTNYSQTSSSRTRGDGFKLKEGRCRLDARRIFFTMRMVKHWHRWHMEMEMSHPWEHSMSGQGWGSEQPYVVEDVPAHCRGSGLDDL